MTMSADSACMDQLTHVGGMRKIWRVGDVLVGIAGDIGAALHFLKWLKLNEPDEDWPQFAGHFHAMVVSPGGKISLFEDGGPEPCYTSDPYCSIGSGSDFALGALACGASPAQAVKAAIKHHGQCKPPVRSYKLKEIE